MLRTRFTMLRKLLVVSATHSQSRARRVVVLLRLGAGQRYSSNVDLFSLEVDLSRDESSTRKDLILPSDRAGPFATVTRFMKCNILRVSAAVQPRRRATALRELRFKVLAQLWHWNTRDQRSFVHLAASMDRLS